MTFLSPRVRYRIVPIVLALIGCAVLLSFFIDVPVAWADVLHWFNFEYWSVSWPNIFAPSVWTLLGFIVADIRHDRRMRRERLHPSSVSELAGQIEALSDKLVELMGGSDDDQ